MLRALMFGAALLALMGLAQAEENVLGGNETFHSSVHGFTFENPDPSRWRFDSGTAEVGETNGCVWASADLADKKNYANIYLLVECQVGGAPVAGWLAGPRFHWENEAHTRDLFTVVHEDYYTEGYAWDVLSDETVPIRLGSGEPAELRIFTLDINGNRRGSAFIHADIETAVGPAYLLVWLRNTGVEATGRLREAALEVAAGIFTEAR